jgi:hypothetical protein
LVEQTVDKCAERRLGVTAVRIVEKKTGNGWGPPSEQTLELASRDRFVNAIVVVRVEDAQSLQRAFEYDILMV